jgi:hypothetical protein
MSLTKPSDYNGRVAITQNKFDASDLQIYLDNLEADYLQDLLGCDLYDLFVADLDVDNLPQTQRFIDIYNKFCNDISTSFYPGQWYFDYYNLYCLNKQNKSRGMLKMLEGFMYFEYVRDQDKLNSSIGVSKSKGVASNMVAPTNTNVIREYNKSLLDYWNIQYYICDNSDVYPEYNGIIKESISLI